MVKKLLAITATVLAVVLLLSSCESMRIVNTVDSLLTPPLYYTEYEGLVDAFNRITGGKPVLITPSDGDCLSAITVDDFDGDGNEEAVVLYRGAQNQAENFASVCFLRNGKDGWNKIENFQGYGNEAYSVSIADLDDDGTSEIMIIWSYSGISGGYVLSVYGGFSSGKCRELTNQPCDSADMIDIDADGLEEIFLISSVTDEGVVTRNAKTLKFVDGKIKIKGSTPVDSGVVAYGSIKTESRGGGKAPRLFIDAVKSDKQMITEIIEWNSETGELTAPLYDETTGTNSLSLRYEQIPCGDIDDDGKIEIPVQSAYGGKDEEENNGLYLTRWMCFDGTKAKCRKKTIVNVQDGYMIDLDKTGVSKIGVTRYPSRSCWIVYRDDGKTKIGNELFTILKVSNKRWNTEDMSGYIPVIENSSGVICVYLTEKGRKTGYDENKLSKMIEETV